MTEAKAVLAFLVWIPLVVVWVIVVVDLIRRPHLHVTTRMIWAAACTLVWPVLIAYLLVRPTRGRLEIPDARADRQSRLVSAALDHEAHRIDDAEMAAIALDLRRV